MNGREIVLRRADARDGIVRGIVSICGGGMLMVSCFRHNMTSFPLGLDMKKAPIAGRLRHIQLYPIM